MKSIPLCGLIAIFTVAACGSANQPDESLRKQAEQGESATATLSEADHKSKGTEVDSEASSVGGQGGIPADNKEDWVCPPEPVRRVLFLSASRHAWMLSERFAGGYTTPLFLPKDVSDPNWDPSLNIVIDFLRDSNKQSHFRLEIDAEFAAFCDGETPLGVQPLRVMNSRLRRFRRD